MVPRLRHGLVTTLSAALTAGCCQIIPSLCPPPTPQPAWTETFNGGTAQGRVADVISTSSGYIAVGADDSGGPFAAAVWRSDDGKTWTREAPNAANFPDGSEIRAIHGPGANGVFVAVGQKSIGHAGVWIAYPSQSSLVNAQFYKNGSLQADSTFQLTDVIILQNVFNPRPAIAVGYVYDSAHGKTQAAVWKSRPPALGGYSAWDEVYREPLDHSMYYPNQYGGSMMTAVLETTSDMSANGGPGFIAVGEYDKLKQALGYGGYVPDPDASIWTSGDGSTWAHLQTDYKLFASVNTSSFNGDQRLNDVKVCAAAIYVGGYDEELFSSTVAPSPMVPPIWRSLDMGNTWVRLTDGHSEDAAAFANPSTIYRLDCNGLPFGFGEVAAGTRSIFGTSAGGFWRGATGYPRWHQMDAFGEAVTLSAVSRRSNILIVAGQDRRSPAIWSYYVTTP